MKVKKRFKLIVYYYSGAIKTLYFTDKRTAEIERHILEINKSGIIATELIDTKKEY